MKPPPRIEPQSGQESVWDYPRPPRLERRPLEIVIEFEGVDVARSTNCLRLLETSHPPTYYLPPEDVRVDLLHPTSGQSYCEWKGVARYYSVHCGNREAKNAAWCYPQPNARYAALRNYLAFYAHLMDACYVDGEPVHPQAGGFYGGWITRHVVGPFKGEPGTTGW